MYQALYRKYRPTRFEDVVGQEVVTKTLVNAINNNRLSHAYIFSGPRGTGKTSIAKILAKAVNCIDQNKIICDKCVNCTQINNKQSVDIIEIDAASNNGIDEIREIRNKVNLVPSTGKYKIYIIDEVHMLTTGAFNALLKTLEEPPAHVIFILATTEFHKIPSTIVSRCQKFEFKKIENIKMIKRIKQIARQENIIIDDNCASELVRLSDGGLRDCISLLDQANAYSNGKIHYDDICAVNGIIGYKTLINFIVALFNKDLKYILKEINIFNNNGKNFVKISEELLVHLRNILLIKVDKEFIDDIDNYSLFLEIDLEDIIKLIELINTGIGNIKNSGNPLLAFELILLKYCNSSVKQYNLKYQNNIQEKDIVLEEENDFSEVQCENEEVCINNKVDNIEKNENIKNIIETDNREIFESKEESTFLEDEIDSVEYNEEKNENINFDKMSSEDLIKKIQKIRIDNALSKFNKQILLVFKNKIDIFKQYSSDKKYSFASDIILDGNLKAISDEYIVFMYNTNLSADTFNRKLDIIEELIEKVFERRLKAVAIDEANWNIIKKEFNEKTREFNYENENPELIISLSNNIIKEQQNLDDLYGSLVKYEEEN